MKDTGSRIFLIFNPQGIVDRDIHLSAKAHPQIKVRSYKIEVQKTAEGHTVEKLELLNVAKAILSFQPDFVLTVNGSGLDNETLLAQLCAYMHLPLVIWYVDEPFRLAEWGERFVPRTTIGITFDRFYEARLRHWGLHWVYTLPLGTNSTRMLEYEANETIDRQAKDNVSFVGGLEYEKIQYLLTNIAIRWPSMPPEMEKILDKSIQVYRLNPKKPIGEIVENCAKKFGVKLTFPDGVVRQMVSSLIDREASFRLRHEVTENLKPFGISVYGERFWEKVLGQAHYKGFIDYYSSEIARVYRTSQINLNVSKFQLKTTLNQRVFDCPLCGGFLITDYKEDVETYFDIDKDIVVFRNLEDLNHKVAYYLRNRKQAKEIIENAKSTILSRHTYSHRLTEMATIVSQIKSHRQFASHCQETIAERQSPRFGPLIKALTQRGYL